MKTVVINPNLTEVAVRPTLKNPDIKVVIGQDANGNYSPKALQYPDSFTDAEVNQKVNKFMAEKEKKPCKVCERYKEQQKQLMEEYNMDYIPNSKQVAGIQVPPTTNVAGIEIPKEPYFTKVYGAPSIAGAKAFLMKKPFLGIPIIALIGVAIVGAVIYAKKKGKI